MLPPWKPGKGGDFAQPPKSALSQRMPPPSFPPPQAPFSKGFKG
jgi:hypothetical protein